MTEGKTYRVELTPGPEYPGERIERITIREAPMHFSGARSYIRSYIHQWRQHDSGSALGWLGEADCEVPDKCRRALRLPVNGRRMTTQWIVLVEAT